MPPGGRALGGRHGTSQIGVITGAHAAYVHALRGNLDHAEAIRDGYIGRAREIPDTQSLAPALSVAALIERTRGRPDEAVALIAEMGDIAFHAWSPIAEGARRRSAWSGGAFERLAEALEREWPEATRIGNGVAHGRAALAEATAGPTAAVPSTPTPPRAGRRSATSTSTAKAAWPRPLPASVRRTMERGACAPRRCERIFSQLGVCLLMPSARSARITRRLSGRVGWQRSFPMAA